MYPKSFPKDMTDWQAIQDEFNAKQDNSTPLMVPEDAIIKPQAPIQSVPNNPMQDNIADDEAAIMPTVLGQGVPTGEEYQANFDKTMAGVPDQDLPAPKIDPREALLEEFRRMRQSDDQALKEARDSDRMLALGGAVGDSLATILNARSQMNVKAPGVQVQQGAGLANTLKNFQTAGQVEGDIKKRREDLLAQYKAMVEGDSSELQRRRVAAYEKQVNAQEANKAKELLAKPSEGEKTLDREFAKVYNDWRTGGKAEYEESRKIYEEAIKDLEKGNVKTGFLQGIGAKVPGIRTDTRETENRVRKAINSMLRATLGAQFTQEEGERVFRQTFDPAASPEENIKNMKTELDKINNRAADLTNQGKFFEKNKTLQGFDYSNEPENKSLPSKNTPAIGSIIKAKGRTFRVIDENGNLEEVK